MFATHEINISDKIDDLLQGSKQTGKMGIYLETEDGNGGSSKSWKEIEVEVQHTEEHAQTLATGVISIAVAMAMTSF